MISTIAQAGIFLIPCFASLGLGVLIGTLALIEAVSSERKTMALSLGAAACLCSVLPGMAAAQAYSLYKGGDSSTLAIAAGFTPALMGAAAIVVTLCRAR